MPQGTPCAVAGYPRLGGTQARALSIQDSRRTLQRVDIRGNSAHLLGKRRAFLHEFNDASLDG